MIGREYDKVLLTLNDRVKYNQDKQLCVPIQKKYPYLAENSLFQAITRTRKELLLLIIGNKELFLEIEKILTWKKFKDNSNISKRLKSLREVNNKTIEELTDIVNDYFNIENTGIIPNRKISKALAKFYNVSWQFIEGEVSDLRYSDFEIAYRNKTKNYNREQKEKLQESLLDFLKEYDN
ncbi:Primosomal protein N' (replication factorY)-superfamily II helicase [Streptococcus infantarius subsp. infantarius]|nr:Primosomal protein N' (replication factorY)-superfamily II helicase [Streptococcus infantarius subsp. infantarius]